MEEKYNKADWGLRHDYVEKLPSFFYTKTKPEKVTRPELIVWNRALAEEIGIEDEDESFLANVLSGNVLLEGAVPIAQAYAGHQFGHFTMLGDGRAILLGEKELHNNELIDIHLKGAGKTAYSRAGDGQAPLGPMLREYLISEAMHELGIPTSRSLAVVTTGEPVFREDVLEGAILTRVASSHIRVGTFQYAAALGDKGQLEALAQYTIERHFPTYANGAHKYVRLLEQVIERQAKLIAEWQLVGFVHGVMNTDNMTVSGETIDYGPCAFIDTFRKDAVFSSIDEMGRYAFGNQPYIGAWNVTRFAEALIPILHEEESRAIEMAEEALSIYESKYAHFYEAGMRAKLGLHEVEAEDSALFQELLVLLEKYEADYTNTFLTFTYDTFVTSEWYEKKDFHQWYKRWQERLKKEARSPEEVVAQMRAHNPAVIPRNHWVEEALQRATEKGDQTLFIKLLDILAEPYAHTKEQRKWGEKPIPNEPYTTFCGT